MIGFAGVDPVPGTWMHVHNVPMDEVQKDYRFGQDNRPALQLPPEQHAQFIGYHRADSRVGPRNYIGVFITVNCSATVARKVAAYFDGERLADYPNVDGVMPFIHTQGCGMEQTGAPCVMFRFLPLADDQAGLEHADVRTDGERHGYKLRNHYRRDG